MIFSEEPEPILFSMVILGESAGFDQILIKDIEDKLGTLTDANAGIIASGGGGALFRIARPPVEVMLTENRWEITARGQDMAGRLASSAAHAVHVFSQYAKDPKWKAIGYNYNIIIRTPDDERAINTIASRTINVEALQERLGYHLLGAATWLYMEVDERRLWLRMEPRGSDFDAKKVFAYGNFYEELAHLPPERELAENFQNLHSKFIELIRRI